jgi:hypothetical protein
MNLTRRLNRLGSAVNVVSPHINHGGCCIYAALVAEELNKQGIHAAGIVTDGWSTPDAHIDEVRPFIKINTIDEWENNGVSFNHVAVEYTIDGKTRHYDTSGVKKPNKRTFCGKRMYEGRLTLKEMKDLAARKQGWNRDFNRAHIPMIRNMVKYYLSVD